MRSFLVMAMFAASLTGSAWRQNCELDDAQAGVAESTGNGASASIVPRPVLPHNVSSDDGSVVLSCANVDAGETGVLQE